MTIAIYREATSISKSTKSHLLVKQDYSNRTALGPNFGKDNILITFNDGLVQNKILFNRTETTTDTLAKPKQDLHFNGYERLESSQLMATYETLEAMHYQQIKTYYQTTKTEQRKQAYEDWRNGGSKPELKPKKIQTIYKGKPDQIHKEFLIAFSSDNDISKYPDTLKELDNPEFYRLAVKAAKNQLKNMGLTDKNLVSIIFHRDEKTPHLHVRYTNFDYKHCQSLNTTVEKRCGNDKKLMMQYRRNLLSQLQKTLNNSFGFELEPKPKDPTRKHKTKREWLEEQNQELETALSEKQQAMANQKFSLDFEILATKNTYQEAKKKLEALETLTIQPQNQNGNNSLVNSFLHFLKVILGKRAADYIEEKKEYLAIKTDIRNQIQPKIIKTIEKQILR